MTESVPSFDELVERAKLAAMKELAYGASHEINNPLANISARAQTLLRDEADPERRRALEAIHQQALRAHEMISDLMLFARPPRVESRLTDLGGLVAIVLRELSAECARREIELRWLPAADLPEVVCDPVQISVVLKALCQNSIDAIGRRGGITIAAAPWGADLHDGGGHSPAAVRIEVSDDGPGISDSVRPHIFDPFYSGREAGRGLGFGLAKAWRIVEQHGGRLTVQNRPEGGTAIAFELPLAGEPSYS